MTSRTVGLHHHRINQAKDPGEAVGNEIQEAATSNCTLWRFQDFAGSDFGVFLFLVLTGRAGIVDISDTEVAVIVNYLTGEEEVVTTPGVTFFLPWLSEAYVMDKSPNEFQMTGTETLITTMSVNCPSGPRMVPLSNSM